jgi:hypothetical protein
MAGEKRLWIGAPFAPEQDSGISERRSGTPGIRGGGLGTTPSMLMSCSAKAARLNTQGAASFRLVFVHVKEWPCRLAENTTIALGESSV